MKLAPIEIKPKEAFANCALKRKPYAETIISIIDSFPTGFVMALDGAWGTGKTTFVDMLHQQLKDDSYNTALFNAWENDFISDPSIAILGEIKRLSGKKEDSVFKNIANNIGTVSGKIAPAVIKSFFKLLKMEDLGDIAAGLTEATISEFNNEIDNYELRKNSISKIRKDLANYIKDNNQSGKPFVFIIDELDRCRPDYAVEVLEKVKHFFSVEGVVFIMVIDKVQLGNSIRGYYGSDRIDADEYLRRFIDLEYELPQPDYLSFAKYLFNKFDLGTFHYRKVHANKDGFPEDDFFSFIEMYSKSKKLTLRQIEKIFALSTVVNRQFNNTDFSNPLLVNYLTFLKITNPELYDKIANQKLDILTLATEIEEDLKECLVKEKDRKYVNTSGQVLLYLIACYQNQLEPSNRLSATLFKDNELVFTPKYVDADWLRTCLEGRYPETSSNINKFTSKIDLLEHLKY